MNEMGIVIFGAFDIGLVYVILKYWVFPEKVGVVKCKEK